jgi:hypothetical protein
LWGEWRLAACDRLSLFVEDCGMCHSLTGRQSPRRQGGDLLALHVTVPRCSSSCAMPVPHRLTSAQLQTVVD